MCGLVTLLHLKVDDEANIGMLTDKLAHRGPDDHAWLAWSDSGIVFGRDQTVAHGKVIMGHRRLSIIDLSVDGRQPMASTDGRLHITYNGEVYNYRELRSELESLGHRFHTRTDTEVMLACLSLWGLDAVARFKGMFAFTLLDLQRRKLYAVRDHFGIKPLYYCRFSRGLAFASEIPPLLELPGVRREPDAQAVYDYLMFGNSAHNQDTMFAGIRQLPPASILEIDVDTLVYEEPSRYWGLGLEENDCGGYEQAVARVRDLFLENIRLHLRSDVPIGSALSGGIDSSAIVCAVRELEPQADIRTFSYIAPGALSEERWVDTVNSRVGATCIKVRPVADDLLRDLDDLITAQGEPFGNTSIYAQYCVFRSASQQGIKVMLDGQGADEMLAGYVGYQGSFLAGLLKQKRFIAAMRFLGRSSRWSGRSRRLITQLAARQLLPPNLQALGRRLIGKPLTPDWLNIGWFRERGVDFSAPDAHNKTVHSLRESLIDTLQRTSLPALLRYEDRNSMRFSLESRVPFLTHDFAELVIGLPAEYLINEAGISKSIFRQAMRGIVPDSVLERQDKLGFATPEDIFTAKLQTVPDDIFNDTELQELFDSRALSGYFYYLAKKIKKRDFRTWRMVNLFRWASVFNVQT
jgi:asparagine synthase (glutamine-hydrolysing)